MALTLGDNFSYLGAKPLDGRVKYDTIADMVAMSASTLYDGIIAFCVADGKNYQWKSTNEVDATLGKWRELATGGGGETYSDFTGATASTAGAHGLVPAPSAGDEGKVLFGSGAWGNLPSVDLSVLSNEAFQFSPIEKPVGTWTDSNNVTKLLYAKTVYNTTPSAVQSDKQFYTDSNIDIKQTSVLWFSVYSTMKFTGMHGGLVNWTVRDNGQSLYVWTRESEYANKDAYITLFYTKTTDNPLPSDVKFAGVTASGEVIYEKTITGISVAVSGDWATVCNIPNADKVIDLIGFYPNVGTGHTNTVWFKEVEISSNGDVKAGSFNSRTITSLTIRYTLAS